MGTWTAFYVEGAREDDVAAACLEWLGAHRGIWAKLTGRRPRARSTEVPDDFWSWGSFRLGGRGPDRVAIFSHSPGWVTVLYNAFPTPNQLAAAVSSGLEARVVDAQAQTTSDAYSIEVFEVGTSVRTLEFADGSWIQNLGAPLPKEPELESPPEDESEPGPGWFDSDAAERYLEQVFGIAWWRLPKSGERVTLIE